MATRRPPGFGHRQSFTFQPIISSFSGWTVPGVPQGPRKRDDAYQTNVCTVTCGSWWYSWSLILFSTACGHSSHHYSRAMLGPRAAAMAFIRLGMLKMHQQTKDVGNRKYGWDAGQLDGGRRFRCLRKKRSSGRGQVFHYSPPRPPNFNVGSVSGFVRAAKKNAHFCKKRLLCPSPNFEVGGAGGGATLSRLIWVSVFFADTGIVCWASRILSSFVSRPLVGSAAQVGARALQAATRCSAAQCGRRLLAGRIDIRVAENPARFGQRNCVQGSGD